MARLQNKVAIITGAGSGMGEATALTFAQQGAKVVATDINTAAVEAVVARIKEAGGEAIAVSHNVAARADWENVFAQAIEAFGAVNILVNNAGISLPTPFAEQTEAMWDKVYNINVDSVMLGMQLAVKHMEENGGSIVNISSTAALTGMAGSGAYTASKGAVSAITRAAAVEFGKKNIRVNAINPGYIITPMSAPQMENPQYKAHFLNGIALPELGTAQNIADTVVFLASDEAAHISGINLAVDGGMTIK